MDILGLFPKDEIWETIRNCFDRRLLESDKGYTGPYSNIPECWDCVCRHLGHLVRYSNVLTDQHPTTIRLQILCSLECGSGNQMLDDKPSSRTNKLQSGAVHQNSRRRTPALRLRESKRMMPECQLRTYAYKSQSYDLQARRHYTGIVSSNTRPSHRRCGPSHTISHDRNAASTKLDQSVSATAGRPVPANGRKTNNCQVC